VAPDSQRLAYLSDCAAGAHGQEGRLCRPTSTPRARRVRDGWPGSTAFAQALRWSGDGKALAFLYVEGGTRRGSALAAAKPQTGEVGVEGVEVQRVAWLASDGGAPKMLTPADRHVYEILARAGRPAARVRWRASARRQQLVDAKLYAQAVAPGATSRVLLDPNVAGTALYRMQVALPRWSPDGNTIAFIGGLMSDQGNTAATFTSCRRRVAVPST
jgi:Tol biopolymer transport system component